MDIVALWFEGFECYSEAEEPRPSNKPARACHFSLQGSIFRT